MVPCCWFVVAGLDAPRCACSFCELIGWKKAWEVSDGTWLRLAALGGLPDTEPEMLPLRLPLCTPRRNGVDCDQAPLEEDKPVFAVPGRDSELFR